MSGGCTFVGSANKNQRNAVLIRGKALLLLLLLFVFIKISTASNAAPSSKPSPPPLLPGRLKLAVLRHGVVGCEGL